MSMTRVQRIVEHVLRTKVSLNCYRLSVIGTSVDRRQIIIDVVILKLAKILRETANDEISAQNARNYDCG